MLSFGKDPIGSKDEVNEDCCYIIVAINIVSSCGEATTRHSQRHKGCHAMLTFGGEVSAMSPKSYQRLTSSANKPRQSELGTE